MRFAIYDHAGKAHYLKQRLVAAGHTPGERLDDIDVLLLDCDWAWAQPRPAMIDAAKQLGVTVVLYPHAGMPTAFVYDGLTEPNPYVAARLEHGPGHLELADLFGSEELGQRSVGWLYSPTAEFKPVKEPRTLFFAPMHPNIEAWQKGINGHDPAPALNQCVYRDLLDLGFDLTVSVVGPSHRSGIWPHPRAKLVQNDQMLYPVSFDLIAQADVVVAAGTVAAAAVASGKPTITLGQHDWSDYIDGEYRRAEHADDYQDFGRYPIDVSDGDLIEVITRACEGDGDVGDWRELFVGDDGTENAIKVLEELTRTKNPARAPAKNVTVGGATAKSGAQVKEG